MHPWPSWNFSIIQPIYRPVACCVNELSRKHIIIATNISGRGTDLRLTEEVKRNGGMHVILTYLPSNQRVEAQAYGRAGRLRGGVPPREGWRVQEYSVE